MYPVVIVQATLRWGLHLRLCRVNPYDPKCSPSKLTTTTIDRTLFEHEQSSSEPLVLLELLVALGVG